MNNFYLEEKTLKIFLHERFKKEVSVPRFKWDEGLFLPDFVIEDLKLIIEYDGPRHYTQASTAVRDFKKTEVYTQHGYKVINIPYFVQLDEAVISDLFSDYKDELNSNSTFNIYPHGFISDKVILPADFCSLGVERFKKDLDNNFSYIRDDIILSLNNKITTRRSKLEVYPYMFI